LVKENGDAVNPVGRLPTDALWDVHRVVMQRLPVKIRYGTPSMAEEQSWSKTYAALCFDAFLTDIRLFSEKTAGSMTRVLKRNRKTWKVLSGAAALPPPLSPHTLATERPPRPYLSAVVVSNKSVERGSRPDLAQVPDEDWIFDREFDVNADW
jgi:hypothetical protein